MRFTILILSILLMQEITCCWAEAISDIYVYNSEALRDPFEMVNILPHDPATENRKREPLEWYSLDSLRMIGCLKKSGEYWALILDGRGRVYRVGLGNYLGQHAGKIEAIDEKKIAITEWLLDGQGLLEKRQVFLYLS